MSEYKKNMETDEVENVFQTDEEKMKRKTENAKMSEQKTLENTEVTETSNTPEYEEPVLIDGEEPYVPEKDEPNINESDEFDEYDERRDRKKSRDDDMERERVWEDEEPYIPEEDEKSVEEEEYDPEAEEGDDEYYEDFLDEQQEEIEALEAERKEKEKAESEKRDKRIKEKRKKEKEKKDQDRREREEAMRRMEAERLASEQNQPSDVPETTSEPTHTTYDEPVVPPVVSSQPDYNNTTNAQTPESYSPSYDNGYKTPEHKDDYKQPEYKHPEPNYEPKQDDYKVPVYNPVEIDGGNFKSQGAYAEPPKFKDHEPVYEVPKHEPPKYDQPKHETESHRSPVYTPPVESVKDASYTEPKTVEEKPYAPAEQKTHIEENTYVPPVYKPTDSGFSKDEHRNNDFYDNPPYSGDSYQTNPSVTPVSVEAEPIRSRVVPESAKNIDSEQLKQEMHSAEYSREHKAEMRDNATNHEQYTSTVEQKTEQPQATKEHRQSENEYRPESHRVIPSVSQQVGEENVPFAPIPTHQHTEPQPDGGFAQRHTEPGVRPVDQQPDAVSYKIDSVEQNKPNDYVPPVTHSDHSPSIPSSEYNHEQVRTEAQNAEYSRAHKIEQSAMGEKVEPVPHTSTSSNGEAIGQSTTPKLDSQIPGARVAGTPLTVDESFHKDNIDTSQRVDVIRDGASVAAPHQPDFDRVVVGKERAYYTDLGVPVSVFTAATIASASGAQTVVSHTVDQTVLGQTVGNIVDKTPTHPVTETAKEFGGQVFNPERKISDEVVMEANETGKTPTKTQQREITMPDYMRAANSVLANYESEIVILGAKISDAEARIKVLESRNVDLKNEAGRIKEIAALKASIQYDETKLSKITADKERVADFIKNGARPMSHITKEDVLTAEYSRGHKLDIKGLKNGEQNEGVVLNGNNRSHQTPNAKRFQSTANLHQVHQNRLSNFAKATAKKTGKGAFAGARRVMREDDDLDKGEEIVSQTARGGQIAYAHVSMISLNNELERLGLGTNALRKSLNDIGVIVGVGDVTTMSLDDLTQIMNTRGKFLAIDKRNQLAEAIDLKRKLGMNSVSLAKSAMREGGDHIYTSSKKLRAMLSDQTLDILERRKIEAALRYKKLAKLHDRVGGRWRMTTGFIRGFIDKVLYKNEDIGELLTLSNNAMAIYRAGKATVRITKSAAQGAEKLASSVSRKLTANQSKSIVGLVNKRGFENHTRAALAKSAGVRQANLTASTSRKTAIGIKAGSKFAQTKIGQWTTKAIEGARALIAGVGKAVSGAISAVAAVISAIASSTVLLYLMIALLIGAVLCGVLFFFVMGDEEANTGVAQMVEYLEEKNSDWLEEIKDIENDNPGTVDYRNQALDEYTKVTYTYLDSNGNKCLVTNNTKEIISMAAVYFQQDFSDEQAVYAYLDELWDASHKLTVTEGDLYGCNGTVCLTESSDLNSDAKGFNAGTRNFYCTEDYENISYSDCSKIDSENEWRQDVDKDGYRFSNAVASASAYSGISDLRTYNSTTSYGDRSLTRTETFYCTDLDTITNSEIIKNIVDDLGMRYSSILNQGGCSIKHPGEYEGAPADYCYDYYRWYEVHRLSYTNLPKDPDASYRFIWSSYKGRYEYECSETDQTYYFYGQGEGRDGKYLNMSSIYVEYDSYSGKFKYYVPYYECEERDCDGHRITYHYCDGDHEEIVCYGHADLAINIEVNSFENDVLFGLDTHTTNYIGEEFEWNEDNVEHAKSLQEQDWEELYEVFIPTSLYGDADGIVSSIMPTHENSLPIPLFNQLDYPNSPYGTEGTVKSHGCGITCIAMVYSYYFDPDISPAYLGRIYGDYNTVDGSKWSVMEDSAAELGIPFEKRTSSWTEVVQALQDGKPVISIQNDNGIFTDSGHFIVLTGITSNGRILVNDPNGSNYYKSDLRSGFENGFTQSQIQVGSSGAYWIYGVKPGTESQPGNQ